jgi:multidrug efflux pump subunit AcrA (membrane-fusion protein)
VTTREGREIFRREAVEHHARPPDAGAVLRLSPSWIRGAYWLLVAVVLCGLGFAAVARIDEHAVGPAVVRIEGKFDVTAKTPAVVAAVEVAAGERVAAGQVLLRFHAEDDQVQAERASHELELQLVRVLATPGDTAARASLVGLRAAKEQAEARLAARLVRAPIDATVGDVRARAGQQVSPGDTLVSLVGDDMQLSVTALLPGQYRPLLRLGGPLRLELDGYHHQYRQLTIDAIGDRVLGPAEIARVLGREVADTVPAPGPVVMVTARLASSTFLAQGQEVRYFDGMIGVGRARVRSESVALTLVPGLRPLLGSSHE